jgi:hypothetical protein
MGPEWPPEITEKVAGKTVYYWTIKPEHKTAKAHAAKSGATAS